MLSYEYKQFLNEKVLEYLPKTFIRVGNKYNGRCMLCGDSKKSATKKRFWYYLDTCSAYCFNCGASMSGLKLLEYLSGRDYHDIKLEYTKLFLKSGLSASLSSYAEVPKEEPGLFDFQPIIKPEWKQPLSQAATEYLAKRKVLTAPFLRDVLYSCYSRNKDREYILIPWKMNGIEAYYQVNDFKKYNAMKYIFPSQRKKLLFGLDNVDLSWNNLTVTEGVYNSIFVKNGIASGTKAITDYQVDLIQQRYPKMSIVLSYDNDEPGITSMIKYIKEGKPFKYFIWFDDMTKEDDINEYVIAKNDVNAFADPAKLESKIYGPLEAKLLLMKRGMWK